MNTTQSPIIGISCRLRVATEVYPPMMGVNLPYFESVLDAGGCPVFIPLVANDAQVDQLFDICDGILIPGGEDVAPELYGEARHATVTSTSDDRDRVELRLAKRAVAEHKPLLAICRGMQILNVGLGGTLYQDVPSDFQTDLEHWPRSNDNIWQSLLHEITIEPESRLGSLLGIREMSVNSLHHQSLKAVGQGLRCVATSSDGVIEAVEHNSHPFCLGIQCHPEALARQVDTRWKSVFSAFVEAAASGK